MGMQARTEPEWEGGARPAAIRSLGSLETRLMKALWAHSGEQSVQEVCDALGPTPANYKTVMTVLNRLVQKSLLVRRLDGRAYRYRPGRSRGWYLESVVRGFVQELVRGFGPDAWHYVVRVVRAMEQPAEPNSPSATWRVERQGWLWFGRVPAIALAGTLLGFLLGRWWHQSR